MANTAPNKIDQVLPEVWQQHVYYEFAMKDAKAALTTMSANPYVLMVPLGIGARGREEVYKFYNEKFLRQLPADITPVPISQAVGKDILVEEAVYRFTHDQVMDWLIPGLAPTGKYVQIGLVAIIKFENDKIASEHIYWDHASLLTQLGVIDQNKVSVKGVESPRTLLEWAGIEDSV